MDIKINEKIVGKELLVYVNIPMTNNKPDLELMIRATVMKGQFKGDLELVAYDPNSNRILRLANKGDSLPSIGDSKFYEAKLKGYYAPGPKGYELAKSQLENLNQIY